MSENRVQIHNSTVDFLVFTKDAQEEGIEIRVRDNTVWLTQRAISQLFDVDRSVVTKHLKKILDSGELEENQYVHFLHKLRMTAIPPPRSLWPGPIIQRNTWG